LEHEGKCSVWGRIYKVILNMSFPEKCKSDKIIPCIASRNNIGVYGSQEIPSLKFYKISRNRVVVNTAMNLQFP
jgi:hypothetical protein